MKLTFDELIEKVKAYTGDRTDDETLELLEDVTDTLTTDNEDWHSRYDDLAKKYKERFSEVKEEKTNEKEEKEDKAITYDDLFEENK